MISAFSTLFKKVWTASQVRKLLEETTSLHQQVRAKHVFCSASCMAEVKFPLPLSQRCYPTHTHTFIISGRAVICPVAIPIFGQPNPPIYTWEKFAEIPKKGKDKRHLLSMPLNGDATIINIFQTSDTSWQALLQALLLKLPDQTPLSKWHTQAELDTPNPPDPPATMWACNSLPRWQ